MGIDPTGELAWWATCLVGGAVSTVTSYIGAKATGGSFTLADAAISFVSGAISYSPLRWGTKAIPALIAGVYSGISAYNCGASMGWSFFDGLLSAGAIFFSFSNWSGLSSKTLSDIAGKMALDLSFGVGNSVVVNASIYVTANYCSQVELNRKYETDLTHWKNMTEHYRGQCIA